MIPEFLRPKTPNPVPIHKKEKDPTNFCHPLQEPQHAIPPFILEDIITLVINIAANKDEQWELLANHLGRNDLINNPDFSNRESRKKNRLRLKAELETVLTTKLSSEWIQELNKISVPAGPVLNIPEILNHKQITDRGLLAQLENIPGLEKDIEVLKTAVLFDGEHLELEGNPPSLGADNIKIYSELGFSEIEINKLKEEGVI